MKMNMPPHRLDAVVFMYGRAFCHSNQMLKVVNLLTIREKEVIIRIQLLGGQFYVCKMDLGRHRS